MAKSKRKGIRLSHRALSDLSKIRKYSIEKWGKSTARRYIADIQTGLSLLGEMPSLLYQKPNISDHFAFYIVREHMLVCIEWEEFVFILTIMHGQMDLPHRIAELENNLIKEAEILYMRALAVEKKRK